MSGVNRTALPVPGPEPAFVFPGPSRLRLRNGLSVWTMERGSLPLATVLLTTPAGAWHDPAGMAGLASLTADMLDEGSGDRSAIEVQEALARLGAELDTDAGHDAVTLSLTLLERHLAQGLHLLAEIVCRPRLSDADVERVRTLRLNRLRQLRDMPAALAERAFAGTLYGHHPYASLAFGSSASLRALSRADVAAFHARAYRPEGTTIIVAGPTPAGGVAAAVEAAFGGWEPDAGAGTAAVADPVPPSAPTARVILIDRPAAAQTELRIGQVAVPRHTPDFHALLVLNSALGGSFVSRLNLNLRERKGYTYGVRSAFEFRRKPGPFSVATSVQTDATADAIAECLGETAAIRDARPVTAEELLIAQQTLTLGYPRNFESSSQVARALSQLVLHDLPDDTLASFAPCVRAQSVESVTAAARTHLDPDRLAVVAVGDAARITDGLDSLGLGPIVLADPEL